MVYAASIAAADGAGAPCPNDVSVSPGYVSYPAIDDPNLPMLSLEFDGQRHDPCDNVISELVGFAVRGRWLHERLTIEDLDSLVRTDGVRLLPLIRILRAFRIAITEQGGVITFAVDGGPQVAIDLSRQQVQINGAARELYFLEAISEITLQADIYIKTEDLSDMLNMELVWDNALYEYRIQLNRQLSIWKLKKSGSLLNVRTQRAPVDLPEKLPPSTGSDDLLQFLEFNWRPSYMWQKESGTGDYHTASTSSPQETIIGHAGGGQYELRISQPGAEWENNEQGLHWEDDDSYVSKIDWFEWVHRFEAAELALGDSSFALGDLIFPTSQMTGIRFNGLTGYDADALESDSSSLGLRKVFDRPYVFEGSAPIGATVELELNDRVIATQDVVPEAESAPGFGTYRFEGVELPGGILNEVVIVITDINGIETRVEKSIIGTPLLLPKGCSAYLGVAGAYRDLNVWDNRNIETGDFSGRIGGGAVSVWLDRTLDHRNDVCSPAGLLSALSGRLVQLISTALSGIQ